MTATIQRLETFVTRQVGVVRVETDDGYEGVGQLAPYNADITARVFHRQVAPHALGSDVGEYEALVDDVLEANYKFPWSYVCRALAGVDTALWDLRGKREGRAVCELLGGSPRPIPAYGSSMRRDIAPAEEADRLREMRARDGYEAFKIRIGTVCGGDEDQWPGRTEAVVPAVREALGDDVDLYVDANSGYTPERAIEVGEMLEEHDVALYEEPCPYWELGWTREVTDAVSMSVGGGEQTNDPAHWRRIVDERVVDVVQPDVCYVGGFTRALRIAERAAARGLPCMPHSANHSLVTVFALHLLAGVDNPGPYVEFSVEPHWAEGLFEPALTVEDGALDVPDGPGWGVHLDSQWLSTADYRVSEAE